MEKRMRQRRNTRNPVAPNGPFPSRPSGAVFIAFIFMLPLLVLQTGPALAQGAPTIAYFSPTGGPAGTVVTVVGENLDNHQSFDLEVTVDSVAQPNILSLTSREARFELAADSTTGPLQLTTSAGSATSSDAFIVSPLTIRVDPERTTLLLEQTRSLNALVQGDPVADVVWSVNGVEGGNATVGTVTQTNPASYTAPDTLPVPDQVLVTATSVANTAVRASVSLQLLDPAGGCPNVEPALSDPADFTGDPDVKVLVSRTRILVLLEEGSSLAPLAPVLNAVGGQIIGGASEFNTIMVSIPDAGTLDDAKAAIDALALLPSVRAVDHDTALQPEGLPDEPEDADSFYLRSEDDAGVVSYTNPTSNVQWAWEVDPASDNWGLEYANFPQAWNLFHYIDKIHATASRLVNVGVVDTAAKYDHQDLNGIVTRLAGGKQQSKPHGTHVCGTIGANWQDGRGITGASPFVKIYNQPTGRESLDAYWAGSLGDNILIGLKRIINQAGGLKAINLSLGYNFRSNSLKLNLDHGVNTGWKWSYDAAGNIDGLVDLPGLPDFNPRQSRMVENHGKMVLETARWAANPASGHQAILVAAAGNDRKDMIAQLATWGIADNTGGAGTDAYQRMLDWNVTNAEYASPFCWAAYNGATNILVVEALKPKSNRDEIERADFSNRARPAPAHPGWDYAFSAPGVDILSCSVVEPAQAYPADGTLKTYELMNGTSMAAPHVTGLIAYLYALDPDLTISNVISILRNTSRFYGDATGAVLGPPAIDAFQAALYIDEINQADPNKRKAIKKALLNIDDGTPDGCDRTVEDDEHGSGLLPADMKIDMSDFRRFRDAFLQILARDIYFDGAADSPKRDLNGDGEIKPGAEENVYPRADFNGDGEISRLEDLEVMADPELWDDAVLKDDGLTAEELHQKLVDFLSSGDLKLDADALFADPEIDNVKVWASVEVNPGDIQIFTVDITSEDIDGPAGDKRKVLTLPADKEARIWASAYKGTEFRYFVLSLDAPAELTPGAASPEKRSIREGEDRLLTFQKVGVYVLADLELDYGEAAAIEAAIEFEDGTRIAMDPFYQIEFTLPVNAGTIAAVGDGYVLTSSSNPGTFTLEAQVRTEQGDPVNPYDQPLANTELLIRTAVIKAPGGMAMDSAGNMYVSDSEEGDITFIPPGEEGLAFLKGLESPGDVEVDVNGRSVIVAEANGKVSRHYFGISGKVTNPAGDLLLYARIYVDTPAGTIPGDAHNKPLSRIETKEDGRFHVLGLLAPEMGADPVEVVVTIEYEGAVQEFPVTLQPVGQTLVDFVFDPPL